MNFLRWIVPARLGLLGAVLLCGVLTMGHDSRAAAPVGLKASLVRSSDLSNLPQVRIENLGDAGISVAVSASLEAPSGSMSRSKSTVYELGAHETKVVPAYKTGSNRLTDRIALARIAVTAEGDPKVDLAAVCGSPEPVGRNAGGFFSMNVHLERFDDSHVWKVLQMLKAAGITSSRVEMGFNAPDANGGYAGAVAAADQQILESEAFGMEAVGCLNYFPGGFDSSPEKLRMAHDWSAALARHYKGRVTSWEFGNETNSGWGAYGAAADMAVLNAAFARGVQSVDPQARVATVGVAEAETGFVRSLLANHAADYMNVLCIHPYGGTAEASVGQCLKIKQIAAQAGFHGEIWADEVGFQYGDGGRINKSTGQPATDNGYNLDQQADQLVRLYTLCKSYGIDRVYWYDFYGLTDPETFWIVNDDFSPRPAYTSLVNLNAAIADATPIGGTDYDEMVQRHYFRNKDGSVTLIAWALQEGVAADLQLPRPLPVKDFLGKTVSASSDGKLTLGNRPVIINGLTADNMPQFLDKDILVSGIDSRTFQAPEQRWSVDAGATFSVPCVVYNMSDRTILARPVVLRTNPGWSIKIPDAFPVAQGQTVTRAFSVTAPAAAVPGVEYHFDLAADIDHGRRTLPYTIRVKTKGNFPYDDILADHGRPDYPMWDNFNEGGTGTGAPVLKATHGSATVDGDLSEWSASEFHPIDQHLRWILRDPWQPDRNDWTGKVALRWDDKNLYAAFVVLDDDLSLVDFTSRDWRDNDHVSLFLSSEPDAKKRTELISKNDYFLFFAPTGISHTEPPITYCASLGGYVHDDVEPQIKLASRVWSGGYVIEVAIPFAAMHITPSAGASLGLNVMAVDSDNGHRQIEAMTYYKDPSYWNSPKAIGNLTLLPE